MIHNVWKKLALMTLNYIIRCIIDIFLDPLKPHIYYISTGLRGSVLHRDFSLMNSILVKCQNDNTSPVTCRADNTSPVLGGVTSYIAPAVKAGLKTRRQVFWESYGPSV